MRLYLSFVSYVLTLVLALCALAYLIWGALTLPVARKWELWQVLLYLFGLLQVIVCFVALVLWARVRYARLVRERKRWTRIMGPEHE